ncbi:hypothetical protein D6827_00440 [Candidatus Parcubacteria bacterium]|nr:MAG: hypothetical protein D6827_00440 [Candidatus Parcubacteria bacterium]
MVKGIDIFRNYFRDYTDNYILIGGAASDEHLTEAGLTFRATKDLDIILIVEALNSEFVEKFWQFVKDGNYDNRQKSTGERKYYRFFAPQNKDFPHQLELFSRKPDVLGLAEDSHLTPIPTDEDLSSLSAILMDDDYYRFTIENSEEENGLHLAKIETLICLKAKAFLDLQSRKINGEQIDERNIRKHKNDVIRLALMLTEESRVTLPQSIESDINEFLESIKSDPPDYKSIGQNTGVPDINGDDIIEQLINTFSL